MNAGLLPLVDRGWLWSRRTRYDGWRRLGPFAPGERPLDKLAKYLAHALDPLAGLRIRRLLDENDDRALAFLLKGHEPDEETAFLLVLDQFEELFTVADEAERRQFDRLLATALEDDDCPLFLFSTMRADFLDRFEALPRLLAARNRLAATWMLGPMVGDALREVVTGPADLAGLVVDEVTEALVAQAEGEPGALPLVQNALIRLWEKSCKKRLNGRLLHEWGGIAGILASSADELLAKVDRERALALLLRLVALDPEGRRHTRQRIARQEAVEAAGGGAAGERLVEQLAGGVDDAERGQLRLIVPTGGGDEPANVELIHETLVQARTVRGEREPKPYWPTLWHHLEAHRSLALQQGRVRLLALRIEDAARAWDAGGRAEADRWREDRFQEAIREVREAGLTMDEVLRDPLARAFFGPADVQAIDAILRAGEAENAAAGSGVYGPPWRTPLGHVARATLGDRLVSIGDTRPGVGVRDGVPDIDWCDVAGGEVALEVKKGQAPTARVAPFRMARYPVTAMQYRAFVEATGAEWRPTARFANQPADSVSWDDALAFCAWLGAQLGLDVRLPSEFEWQLAATGGDPANTYPWGAKWDVAREPWRANTARSGPGRMSAVGVYPRGAAAAGMLDLAGNVREWCANLYDTPISTEATHGGDRPRVVRGGSWNGGRGGARCADRDVDHHDSRYDDLGFRVVCSSPIVTADP